MAYVGRQSSGKDEKEIYMLAKMMGGKTSDVKLGVL